LYRSPQEQRVIPWFQAKGDKTFRLDYDLNENSLVFDLGGHEGQWASDIFSRYCCTIHIFEPVQEFAGLIEQRFSKNRKILVHKFGLASQSRKATIAVCGDGSSIFKDGRDLREITLMRASDFFRENGIREIDLMKINIEGAEYELLEHLIEAGFTPCIKNIQVQFHDFVPHAHERMVAIQARLADSHLVTYQYAFVWENWRIKDEPGAVRRLTKA
jgi:FkbM family methyltransferase